MKTCFIKRIDESLLRHLQDVHGEIRQKQTYSLHTVSDKMKNNRIQERWPYRRLQDGINQEGYFKRSDEGQKRKHDEPKIEGSRSRQRDHKENTERKRYGVYL